MLECRDIEVPMVEQNYWHKTLIKEFWKIHKMDEDVEEAKLLVSHQEEELFALSKIVAAKYEAMDVKEVIGKKTNLTIPERLLLSKVLTSRIKACQGKMGNWKGNPINLELHPGVEPVVSIPFQIT